MTMQPIRTKLSYANVAATLALFLALGGGLAVAAGKIGSKQIKPDAVKAKHVKDGQIKSAEIGDGQVGSAEIGDLQVTAAKTGAGVLDQCAPGAVAGYVEVSASASFPAAFTGAGVRGFACNGAALVRREDEGSYVVCLTGVPEGSIGTAAGSSDHAAGFDPTSRDNFVTFSRETEDNNCPGADLSVRSFDADGNVPQDKDFSLIVTAR